MKRERCGSDCEEQPFDQKNRAWSPEIVRPSNPRVYIKERKRVGQWLLSDGFNEFTRSDPAHTHLGAWDLTAMRGFDPPVLPEEVDLLAGLDEAPVAQNVFEGFEGRLNPGASFRDDPSLRVLKGRCRSGRSFVAFRTARGGGVCVLHERYFATARWTWCVHCDAESRRCLERLGVPDVLEVHGRAHLLRSLRTIAHPDVKWCPH